MKRLVIIALILSTSSLLFFRCDKDEPDDDTAEQAYTDFENEVYSKINDYRTSQALDSLTNNETIRLEARIHSKNMAQGRVGFGHDGFDSRADNIRNALGGNEVAENVAYGFNEADSVLKAWINSPGHKENIVDTFTMTGVGIAKSNDGNYYFTQLFLNK